MDGRADHACDDCPVRQFGLCSAFIGDPPRKLLRQYRGEKTVSPRRYLQRAGEKAKTVKIIRNGWAAYVSNTELGERLIADFLLAGDFLGAGALVKGRTYYAIQAVTTVTYCEFDRELFREIAAGDDAIAGAMYRLAVDSWEKNQRRLFDLARRDAEERILSLLVDLYDRLAALGLAGDGTMDFPLRQAQLADALGLTQVHVSRVLKKLRDDGMLALDRNALAFEDMDALRIRLR